MCVEWAGLAGLACVGKPGPVAGEFTGVLAYLPAFALGCHPGNGPRRRGGDKGYSRFYP